MSSNSKHYSTARHWIAACAAMGLAAAFLLPAVQIEAQPAPSSAAKKPAAAAPAPAAELTPSHLAAARELVLASGMSRSFDAAIPQLIKRLTETYTQTRPDLAPDLKIVLKDMQPEFTKDTDQMVDKAAHILAGLLSEPDIKVAVAFFSSPAGKKYVQAQPYFFDDVINAMQDWHQQVATHLMTRVRAELKKKGHTL
ncbi:MAG: DUF2059 domain-containing protein [Methylovirgula sp.]